jgi:YjbE family integral membrane protein
MSAGIDWAGLAGALFQVVMIDLTLAGDNAVAVGLAAAGLPPDNRRRAIFLGLAGSAVMLCGFALIAARLLQIIGLLLAGGLLLLWVCWRMWRDLRAEQEKRHPHAPHAKTLRQALTQIFIADLSMSLDNVLAVAGAARAHPGALVFGLLLSITLTGLAASAIARLMKRAPWIGYIGLAIVIFVAGHMIWDGAHQIAAHVG